MANNADTLQRVYDNYCRIFVMVTEVIANPTQANIDLLTSAAEGASVIQPKINYSLDGETYDWLGYQQALGEIMANVRKQMVFAAGPFWVQSQGF